MPLSVTILNNRLFVVSVFVVVVVVIVEGEGDNREGDSEILSILSTWIVDCNDIADINFVEIEEEEEEEVVVVVGREEWFVEDPSIPAKSISNDWNEYSAVSKGDEE